MMSGRKTGRYFISLHAEIMAHSERTPFMFRHVMRCGIILCWLPMRYLALFTVNAAAGCGRAPVPSACACVRVRGGVNHLFMSLFWPVRLSIQIVIMGDVQSAVHGCLLIKQLKVQP